MRENLNNSFDIINEGANQTSSSEQAQKAHPEDFPLELKPEAMAIVLAGGQGTKLRVLDSRTPKPFLPLAEQYKIIDASIASTRSLSIKSTYIATHTRDDEFISYLEKRWGNLITLLDEQAPRGHGRVLVDSIKIIENDPAENIIIAPGDHLHSIDFASVLNIHNQNGSDLSIMSKEVSYEESARHDLLHLEGDRVRGVRESNPDSQNFASIGVYILRKNFLLPILHKLQKVKLETADIGKDVLPIFFSNGKVSTFKFKKYWEDMGTPDRYYKANMDLLKNPEILSSNGLFDFNRIGENFISKDCYISKQASLQNSIVNKGCFVSDGVKLNNVILLENVTIDPGININDAIVSEGVHLTKKSLGIAKSHIMETMMGVVIYK